MAFVPAKLFFNPLRRYGLRSDFPLGLPSATTPKKPLVFDLLLTESHNRTSSITSHKIETGSNSINDNIYNNPETASLTGMVTNFSVNQGLTITNRAQTAFDLLESIWKSKANVMVLTVMRIYNDMAISNISINRSEETGEAVVINLSFIKLNVVKLQAVALSLDVSPSLSSAAGRQAALSLSVGQQTGL